VPRARPQGDRTASAGWYNLAALGRLARDAGHDVAFVNGDAYTDELKRRRSSCSRSGAKLDSVVYTSRARSAPTRRPASPRVGPQASRRAVRQQEHRPRQRSGADVEIAPATDADVEATRKVMGGEDWALWMRALLEADLLAKGCRTVAYSYIGPELTYPIYRSGTIGKAKEHLEETARSSRPSSAGAWAAPRTSASTRPS